jgi:hypothetical protein
LIIHGVIEIKSVTLSLKKTLTQIERHILRLNGGVWKVYIVTGQKTFLVSYS